MHGEIHQNEINKKDDLIIERGIANFIFFLHENIWCWNSIEASSIEYPYWDDSVEFLQAMFFWKNKKYIAIFIMENIVQSMNVILSMHG